MIENKILLPEEIVSNLNLQDLPGEIWKDIVGYEGIYQISSLGRVKSLSRIKQRKSNLKITNEILQKILDLKSQGKSLRFLSNEFKIDRRQITKHLKRYKGFLDFNEDILSVTRIRRLQVDKDGYYKVILIKNGKQKPFRVHRLVGEAFLDNQNKKPEINHKDGNKQNNLYTNLEWVTVKENDFHARFHGLKKPSFGEKSGMSKLKEDLVKRMKTIFSYGFFSKMEVAQICGVNYKNAHSILSGKTWKHIII